MTTANDRQVAGEHYRTADYQHWDLVADLRLGYFDGQVTRYISRAKAKNGVEDLEKALHYAQKTAELASTGAYPLIYRNQRAGYVDTRRLCSKHSAAMKHDPLTERALLVACTWESVADLEHLMRLIVELAMTLPRSEEGGATSRYVGQ
jgi:hypothetical protein